MADRIRKLPERPIGACSVIMSWGSLRPDKGPRLRGEYKRAVQA